MTTILRPSLQERHQCFVACPEKGNKACEESGAQLVLGVAEETGTVKSEDEEKQGKPYCSL